jgi:uroporphyrinogen III methyltransferase/synthase
MTGRVYLVGAGPGDPGLLTLRGQRCLARAEVVVHDDLVNAGSSSTRRPAPRSSDVGRLARRTDGSTRTRSARCVVRYARGPARSVVRLKNGDPFRLRPRRRGGAGAPPRGIPFEVVPGVTSALACRRTRASRPRSRPCLAGDDRDRHSAARGDGPTTAPGLPWEALARQGGTLVF